MQALDPIPVARFADCETNSARARQLASQPSLLSPSAVQQLCSLVAEFAAKDLNRARLAAANAFWLAHQFNHLPSKALGTRALANALRLRSQLKAARAAYQLAIRLFTDASDPHQVAITKSSALLTLSFLAEHEQAYLWADEARSVFEERSDTLRLARLDVNLGAVFYRQERLEDALEQWEQALATFEQLSLAQESAQTLKNIATCNIGLYRFEAAAKAFQAALALAKQHGLHSLLHDIEYNIAYLYYLKGNHAEAIQAYSTARKRSQDASDPYIAALCDLDEAEIYLELNLLTEARELADRAAGAFSQLRVSYEQARAITISAIVAGRQNRFQTSLSLLERSSELFKREGNRRWLALVQLYRALALFREGRLYEARRFAENALDSLPPTKAPLATLLLAQVYLDLAQTDRAATLASAARHQLEGLNRPDLLYQAWFLVGEVEEQRGKTALALQAYRQAEAALDRLRTTVTTSETKMGILSDHLLVYERLFSTSYRGSDQDPSEPEPELLWIAEKAKAQSLADLLSLTAPVFRLPSGTRSSLVERVRKLREQLTWFHRQLDHSELSEYPPSPHRLDAIMRSTQATDRELAETLASLRESDDSYKDLDTAAVASRDVIQGALGRGDLLLQYYVAEDIVFALMLSDSTYKVVPLGVATSLEEKQRQLDFQLREAHRLRSQRPGRPQVIESLLKGFYDVLLRPLEIPTATKRLIVVPHGFLFYLPFQAFLDEDVPLIRRYRIAYFPTSTDVAKYRTGHTFRSSRTGGSFEQVVQTIHGRFSVRGDNPIFSRLDSDGASATLLNLFQSKSPKEIVLIDAFSDPESRIGNALEVVGLVRGLMSAGARAILFPLWPAHSDSQFLRRLQASWDGNSKLDVQVQQAYQEALDHSAGCSEWAPFVLYGL